ncbi:hypothetical protein [Ruegeria lacuscaerulensis]|uniref:hypothetical protein n=1 Tax=Ruegeria lacuscaerulensis TaxID=55218 RepID=UPI00147BEC3F|nr:hypothetical protein [Ruegeria lacuscaerulensis]
MNANRIIDIIVRQVMRRLVNKGVDKGFDVASRMGGKSEQQTGKPGTGRPVQGNAGRSAQGMKQAQRMTRQMRRFMKF